MGDSERKFVVVYDGTDGQSLDSITPLARGQVVEARAGRQRLSRRSFGQTGRDITLNRRSLRASCRARQSRH